MEQARAHRRGTAVLLFLRPPRDQGRRRFEPGRTQTDRPEGRPSGAHAVEFSKTVAPSCGEGTPPGSARRAPLRVPGGPTSIALPDRSSRGRRAATEPTAARKSSRPRPGRKWARPAGSGDDLDVHGPLARPVVEVDQHALLPRAEDEAPAHERDRERGAEQGRAQVRVRVVVVVARVVGVVAALGPRPGHQPLDRLLEVLDPARLVLHGRDRGRRARHEDGHDAVVDPRGAQRAGQAVREVDDLPLALRLEAQERRVDGHQAAWSRTKRRLPTWRTRPSRSAAGRSSSATGSPSSRTPPWAMLRRASERDIPNWSPSSSGRWTSAPSRRTVGMSSGTSRAMWTRSKPASASSAVPSPWKRATSARASARLASRGLAPAGGDAPSS